MITNEEFENIKSEYQKGNLKIGVELSNGRKFLIDIAKDTTCLIWTASLTLIMIISLTFEWKLMVLSFFTCLSIMWSYLFYKYILQKVVHEALRDKRIFEFLLENNIIALL